jgi:hypothetical protein
MNVGAIAGLLQRVFQLIEIGRHRRFIAGRQTLGYERDVIRIPNFDPAI